MKRKRVLLYDTDLPLPSNTNSFSDSSKKPDSGLSKIELDFCFRYTSHYDRARAVIQAGYSPASAHITARKLLTRYDIKQQIASIERERLRRLRFDGDEFLAREIVLATAPITEIIETWIPPCRYCYGRNYEYQRTHSEFLEAYEEHIRQPDRNRSYRTVLLDSGNTILYDETGRKLPFDQKGGDGYDAEQPPNPACPNCFGRGLEVPDQGTVPYIKLKDSRELSDIGKILYAGIERSNKGVKQLIQNQEAARTRLMAMLGKFLELRTADLAFNTVPGQEKPPISFQMALTGGATRLVDNDPRNMSDSELDAALAQYGINLSVGIEQGGEGEDSFTDPGEATSDQDFS